MDAATAAAATAVTVKSNQRKKGMTRTLSQRVEGGDLVKFDRSIDRSIQTSTLSSGDKLKIGILLRP